MKTALQEWNASLREDPKRLLLPLTLGLVLFCIFRSCFPGLGGDQLPPEVLEQFTQSHVDCVGIDELQIWPGDHRQPECGRVYVKTVAEGSVPPEEADVGITRAICFQVTLENPRWVTQAQTRHEILFFERSLFKVAVLKNGDWHLFPDVDAQDEQRWLEYGCPGEYQVEH